MSDNLFNYQTLIKVAGMPNAPQIFEAFKNKID